MVIKQDLWNDLVPHDISFNRFLIKQLLQEQPDTIYMCTCQMYIPFLFHELKEAYIALLSLILFPQ